MARTALVALVALSLCGCDGDLLNLGTSEPLTGGGAGGSAGSDTAGSAGSSGVAGDDSSREWLEPQLLFPQDDELIVSNPTFTEQGDVLFYTEKPAGDDQLARIYRRTRVGAAWGDRQELDVGTDASNPAISPSGLELWFGQNVAGGLGETDIWLSRWQGSVWSTPEHFGAPLNSASHDVPRPPAAGGTIMPLSSKRHGGALYQIYLATRTADDQPWQDVSSDLLASINSKSFESVDGFLTADGLTLYFSSTRNADQQGDLFVAQRSSLQGAFGEPRALRDLNTERDERDPWLSTDGKHLYFSSNRGGQYALYASQFAR